MVCLTISLNVNRAGLLRESFFLALLYKKVIIPFLTVGYVKKGEKCLFKGIFLPFKIVVWEASYEIFLIFLLRSLG